MLGLPAWVWVILGIFVCIFGAIRLLYAKFRAMCRAVRGELVEFLKANYPQVTVVGERQGNLVLQIEGEGERVWEMTDIYTAVGRLPGMGRDPAARTRIYQQAAVLQFPPAVDSSQPLTLATHGDRIRPQLLKPETFNEFLPANIILNNPIPGLNLTVVYSIHPLRYNRYLTEQDLSDLGMDIADLHKLALENLRKDFPREMVTQAVTAESGTAVQFGDSLDAARLLLVPEYLQADEELIALVPHRDMMVLLPASVRQDPDKLRNGMQLLRQDHGHEPLLDRPVRVTHEGFELL